VVLKQVLNDGFIVSQTFNQLEANHANTLGTLLEKTVKFAWVQSSPKAKRVFGFSGSVVLTA
jgi:hypothetical protein